MRLKSAMSIERAVPLLLLLLVAAGCTKSPQDAQAEQIRGEARNQAEVIENRAETQARPLDQQADALHNQAKQAGGYDGKRLDVQADALKEQARLLRKQAHEQSDAVKEGADARIKALRSR